MSASDSTTTLVKRLDELRAEDRPVVGGKGASLGELIRAGVEVPSGYVVTTAAFERAMSALDPDGDLRRRIGRLSADDPAVSSTIEGLRERIVAAPPLEDLRAAITEQYQALGGADADAPVAVRSSATSEDSADASFAGVQDTYLWVRGADRVIEHVGRCWASLYNLESVAYRLRRAIPEEGLAMAVVVQQMVDAHCSGVMFTCGPTTGDRSVIAIEASWGLGSAIVSGEVTPDTFTVSKVTGEVLRRETSIKHRRHRMDPSGHGVMSEEVPEELRSRPCLTEEQLEILVGLARRVERHYGCPQDIEWAIPTGRDPTEILLLQSRPETVWAKRTSGPIAAPKARAFDHVIGALGGAAAQRDDGATG